ncbi:LysM peptidoglycan-binding domain-containing protein [Nocardia sp. CA-135398]|uniref:LysM peptidoglycan-binding domain-containing protein n=1 Tax=Nocardia sp. CA-135398 TaxID=3239977 RepID=UPI003D983BF3
MARTHVVVDGDTLSGIAQQFYGDAALFPVIAAANKIANPDIVEIGQVLSIPDVTRTHVVVDGDTLSGIAQQFYGDAALFPVIAAANNIANPDIIQVGQLLSIPELAPQPGGGSGPGGQPPVTGKIDLSQFAGTLPYDSQLYGVYQPLLGWKSIRLQRRFQPALSSVGEGALVQTALGIVPVVDMNPPAPVPHLTVAGEDVVADTAPTPSVKLGSVAPATIANAPGSLDSVFASLMRDKLKPFARADVAQWRPLFAPDKLQQVLDQATSQLSSAHAAAIRALDHLALDVPGASDALLQTRLNRESVVAGSVHRLNQQNNTAALTQLFFADQNLTVAPTDVSGLFDPLETLDPGHGGISQVSLSPIGIVHLFRQYFFEFASFLGTPVQHVWLSPGGTVELLEVSTRKTTVEKFTETALEQTQKTDTSTTTQDELSDAVREENQQNSKLGVGATGSVSGGVGPVFTAQGSTSLNFDLDTSLKQAKEQTHKQTRQQTQSTSSQIKSNYKSTLRVVTETTDTSSKRYVLQNTTDKLVNYELRRKMRQIGVQLQDLGTQLCWQTYVDDPGRELGVAKLVHIAEPPDLSHVQPPQLIPIPDPEVKATPVSLNIEWFFEDRKFGFVPIGGVLQLVPPQAGYIFDRAEVVVTSGDHWAWGYHVGESRQIDDGQGGKEDSVSSIVVGVTTAPGGLETDEHPKFTIQVTPIWRPSKKLLFDVNTQNTTKLASVDAEKTRLAQEAYITAAQDRVKAASNVAPRPYSDLREEERIIVFRNLIRQLTKEVGLDGEQPQVRHVVAELIQAMFDTDSMLYFVAPEWWVPRVRQLKVFNWTVTEQTPQNIGLDGTYPDFDKKQTVSWGGANSNRPDNYYITGDSTPARLGSSLGWVLQLDGDNSRNAFLNAPWVKAVIPVRAGKELDAVNWLQRNAVEGTDGLAALYQAGTPAAAQQVLSTLKAYPWPAGSLQRQRYDTIQPSALTIRDAITYLAIRINSKYQTSLQKVTDPQDPTLSYLPTDKVYETGFDHLKGGFVATGTTPYAVFDEWIEVMPTDQIVAVEVRYDPKTGQQIPIPPVPNPMH